MRHPDTPRFFIVDDDPFSRMFYHQYLKNMGYNNSIVFENGEDCLNRLGMQPDIVLLDYDMQPFNGIEVLQRVKRYNPNIQLLIISAINNDKIASEAIAGGAVAYILKGDRDLDQLGKTIDRILENSIYKFSHNPDENQVC